MKLWLFFKRVLIINWKLIIVRFNYDLISFKQHLILFERFAHLFKHRYLISIEILSQRKLFLQNLNFPLILILLHINKLVKIVF
jgi:hypothetical protein